MGSDDQDQKSKVAASTVSEVDDLNSLSLSIIPFENSTLKNARLVKNEKRESEFELHSDPVSGSLRIHPADISSQVGANEKDQQIIMGLARLGSYDVYTLQSCLSSMGVKLEDDSRLELSDGMKDLLAEMTSQFTRPMIQKIFGGAGEDAGDPDIWHKTFYDPDVKRVRQNLLKMESTTGIPLADIPQFLEEYSALFLSVAYYRYNFDQMVPEILRFKTWMKELKASREVKGSPRMMKTCTSVEEDMNFLVASMSERLQRFQASFEMFWSNINKDGFERFRQQIQENQNSMGSLLCGLSIKMNTWQKEFPDNTVGGPGTRAKFVMSVMEGGLSRLRHEEGLARAKLGMAVR